MADGKELIKMLNLEPHPYGGFYTSVHRSTEGVSPADGRGVRSATTTIHLVMEHGDIDPWHKMKSEETFFYHRGCSLKLYTLSEDGKLESQIVGDQTVDPEAKFAVVIPANIWFAGELVHEEHASYGFYSVSVSPGFNYGDSEIAVSETLCEQFPQHREILERLVLKPKSTDEEHVDQAEDQANGSQRE